MSYSYKSYTNTKEVMKKFVNAQEAEIIYGIGKTRIMVLANEAKAIYKIGTTALINIDVFDDYLEKFREPQRALPIHSCDKLKEKYKKVKN